MPVRLILYRGNEKLGLDLKDGVYRIGRDKPADIVIPDPTVSGSHAELQINGSTVQIRDLGSTNGTFINDAPVSAITPVTPSDQLRLGSVKVGIELVEEEKPVRAPSRPAGEVAAEKVAAVKGAASKLKWSLRYWLGGAGALMLLMLLFMFVQIYAEQSDAERRQASRFKSFAAQ
ncbi:MAG TPA: FHA domain-containing protein, partial [Thermoanaerobaculia bacterium]|nr:FHA domain-containing protein [Thermoanaerobaculia bacterium]